jgi:hypothetical protein
MKWDWWSRWRGRSNAECGHPRAPIEGISTADGNDMHGAPLKDIQQAAAGAETWKN